MNIVRRMLLNAYILYDQTTADAPRISRFQFTQHAVEQLVADHLASRRRGQRKHRAPNNAIHMLLVPNEWYFY